MNEGQMAPTCPVCAEQVAGDDRFCEGCGVDLVVRVADSGQVSVDAATPCTRCGAAGIRADGCCEHCGTPRPRGRDRVEIDLGEVSGVSDRGLRHHHNEDALAIARVGPSDLTEAVVAVVCDGVSSANRPEVASQTAADTAADALVNSVRAGHELEGATYSAVSRAANAVAGLVTPEDQGNAPSCTCVSAVVTADRVVLGWVGDSRAYWLATPEAAAAGTPSKCLTSDDSWAEHTIASGALTPDEAFADPRAHALLRWLGADAGEVHPRTATFRPGGPGVVLVCSDGLWNYVWGSKELAKKVLPAGLSAPLDAARLLTRIALDHGGRDNITVAVVPFPLGGPVARS